VAGTPPPPATIVDVGGAAGRYSLWLAGHASALAGLVRKLTLDPRFVEIRDRDLATGEHRNDTGRIEYFTTAYFHRPEELRAEFERAGFGDIQVLGVEGLGEWLTDFDERWADPALRYDVLDVARRLEAEPSIVGMSAHLLAVGRRSTATGGPHGADPRASRDSVTS